MSNRIEETIKKAQDQGKVAFIGLVPIDPDSMDNSMEIVDRMISSGVDILMVHIPNWFPWMEGAVLQKAAQIPRNAGVTRDNVFEFIKTVRIKYPEIPIINMTLYETIMTMGQDRYLKLSKVADVDGHDIPNYPLFYTDDKMGFYKECLERNQHLILAISYELAVSEEGSDEYILLRKMIGAAKGFVFVMNAPGGQSGSDAKLTDQQLTMAVGRVKDLLKEQGNDCYVSIVCGISSSEDIEKVKVSGAHCFMIGSAYIKSLQEGQTLDEISDYLEGVSEMCKY